MNSAGNKPKSSEKSSCKGSNRPELSWNLKIGFKSGSQPSLSWHKGLATPPHRSLHLPVPRILLRRSWISRCPRETRGSRSTVSVTQHDPLLPSWSHPAGVLDFFFIFFFSASFNLKALLQTDPRRSRSHPSLWLGCLGSSRYNLNMQQHHLLSKVIRDKCSCKAINYQPGMCGTKARGAVLLGTNPEYLHPYRGSSFFQKRMDKFQFFFFC